MWQNATATARDTYKQGQVLVGIAVTFGAGALLFSHCEEYRVRDLRFLRFRESTNGHGT